VTSRGDPAWLADLAGTLTQVDEFLRSPAGHAALEIAAFLFIPPQIRNEKKSLTSTGR
jgi:hypothetical protein